MYRNEKRKFVYKGLGLSKAILYVFNFSLYASVTLQNLGVCKAFGYCFRMKHALLQKYTISEILYALSSTHLYFCLVVGKRIFATKLRYNSIRGVQGNL